MQLLLVIGVLTRLIHGWGNWRLPANLPDHYTFEDWPFGMYGCIQAYPSSTWSHDMGRHWATTKTLPFRVNWVETTGDPNLVTFWCQRSDITGELIIRYPDKLDGPYYFHCTSEHWLVYIVGSGRAEQLACVPDKETESITLTGHDRKCLNMEVHRYPNAKFFVAWLQDEKSGKGALVHPFKIVEKRGPDNTFTMAFSDYVNSSGAIVEINRNRTMYAFCPKAPNGMTLTLRVGAINQKWTDFDTNYQIDTTLSWAEEASPYVWAWVKQNLIKFFIGAEFGYLF